jgi:hypothetical protein
MGMIRTIFRSWSANSATRTLPISAVSSQWHRHAEPSGKYSITSDIPASLSPAQISAIKSVMLILAVEAHPESAGLLGLAERARSGE